MAECKPPGLSTIGKDEDNALVFKDSTGNTAELKVGGNALIFTPTNGAGKAKIVKISNVADGKLAVVHQKPSRVNNFML